MFFFYLMTIVVNHMVLPKSGQLDTFEVVTKRVNCTVNWNI